MRYSIHWLRGGSAPLLAALTIAGTLLLCATAASAHPASVAPAARSTSCRASLAKDNTWDKLGPTYVESLTVSGVSCGSGLTQIKDYNKCRLAHGGLKGRCTVPVNGYRCSEIRDSSSDQFVAKVTCTKSRDAIDFTYSENT